MFAVDLPVAFFYARLYGRDRGDPEELICRTLADMVPATTGEIAEATGLDARVVEATLDHMATRYRVMFNPLTKRFSLPRLGSARSFAA
jgi:hypothetical protein